MGTGGPFTNTVQYPDGRQEIINLPKAFSPGDLVAVTHRRAGGVVVQRVSPVAALYSAGIEITTLYNGLTPGNTYQIRFNAKIGTVQGESVADYIYVRLYWWYGNAYEEHYSTEYETVYNGSELTTDWASYSTPEFICPYGGEIGFGFSIYPYEAKRNSLPIYFDSPEILIGETWTPLAGWSWVDPVSTSGWFKYLVYGDIDADISEGFLKIDFTG